MVFVNPFLNVNDAATGMTITDDTTKSPTTFIDAEIVALSKTENKVLKNELFSFDTFENSSSRIMRTNFLENFISNIITIMLVHTINIKSDLFNVNILPKIMLSIFMLTIPLLEIIIAIPKLKVRIIESEISEKFL